MSLPLLPTTTVGSFPKPEYLLRARAQRTRGEISPQTLQELEEKATREWIELQERLGLDILVDGEMYRGDMATYFAENLEGLKISGLVRSYGNRYYRKPIVTGSIQRSRPVTVRWWRFTQSLTKKPVKGMLTGPYTLMDWSFDEHYGSRRDCALAFAEALREEAEDLERAGATYIQIDEPAVSVRPQELELAIEALGCVTQNLKVKTITHICYGRFEEIYPEMLRLPVDQIDLEMANSGYDLLNLFKKNPFDKEIGLGVLDVHSHHVETEEQILSGLQKTLKVLSPEQVTVDPDCGLKTRTREEVEKKLAVMVSAVKKLRQELKSPAAR
ncbi:MAG: methionine synthase [Elusimicrobia bacterium]|nr:methionine synthase [Elusimicrobiota bacterium]